MEEPWGKKNYSKNCPFSCGKNIKLHRRRPQIASTHPNCPKKRKELSICNHEERQGWETRRQRQPRAAQDGNHEEGQSWETRQQRQPRAAQNGDHEGRQAWEARRQRQPRAAQNGLRPYRVIQVFSAKTMKTFRKKSKSFCFSIFGLFDFSILPELLSKSSFFFFDFLTFRFCPNFSQKVSFFLFFDFSPFQFRQNFKTQI